MGWATPCPNCSSFFQTKKSKGEIKKSNLPEFQWTPACQEGFDQLKKALTEAPVLAYLDYSKPFILETDESLKGLGTVLSQKGVDIQICVIAYASRSLRPSEKSMQDYSLAKIELMALKAFATSLRTTCSGQNSLFLQITICFVTLSPVN